jgi:hypothetical protein
MIGMYFAWAESDLWPAYILNPDPSKVRPVRAGFPKTNDGKQKKIEFGNGPEIMEEMRELASTYWPVPNKDEPLSYDAAGLERAIRIAEGHAVEHQRDVGMKAAIDIALTIKDHQAAGEVVEMFATRFVREAKFGREIATSRKAWQLFCSGSLAYVLDTGTRAVTQFVDDVIAILEERLKQPRRPLEDKTIAELAELFSQHYIASHADQFDDRSEDTDDHTPKSCLKPPANPEQISALEKKVGELPQDYRDFLLRSDGFSCDNPCLDSWFFSVEEMLEDEEDYDMSDWTAELIPYAETCHLSIGEVKWPEIKMRCNIGRGGDEGMVMILEPSVGKKAIQVFDEAYDAATAEEKTLLARAVTEVYGSVEAMRAMTWPVALWYHWDPEIRMSGLVYARKWLRISANLILGVSNRC